MTKRLLVVFATLALTVAAAKTYTVTLFEPAVLNGKELKAGDYKLEVNGDRMVMRSGKEAGEAPVKVEETAQKFARTSVRYATAGGKNQIQEIRLGGTKTKLIVSQ